MFSQNHIFSSCSFLLFILNWSWFSFDVDVKIFQSLSHSRHYSESQVSLICVPLNTHSIEYVSKKWQISVRCIFHILQFLW